MMITSPSPASHRLRSRLSGGTARKAFTNGYRRLCIYMQGRLLTALTAAYIAGLAAAPFFPAAGWRIAAAAALCLAAAFFCHMRFPGGKGALAALLCAALFCGVFAAQTAQKQIDAFPAEDGRPMVVQGRVADIPYRDGDRQRLRLAVDVIDGTPYRGGDIYLYAPAGLAIPPGGYLRAGGKISVMESSGNANAFRYQDYLRRQGIAASLFCGGDDTVTVLSQGSPFCLWKIGGWIRQRLEKAIACIPQDSADLWRGIFLGDKQDLDYQTKEALSLSGFLHAFAVSGLHVGFVIALACALAGSGFTRRWRRFLFSLLFMGFYISLTGPTPSVLRAAIMAFFLLLGQAMGEKNDAVTSLSAAALLCLLYRPLWLGDAGFQLSFAAVAGIFLFAPPFFKLFSALPRFLQESFSLSWAASLGALPLISYYFFHVTWLGWLFSPLVLLIAAITVLVSLFAAAAACFSPLAASYLLEPVCWMLDFCRQAVGRLSDLPGMFSLTGAISPWLVALYFLLLAAAAWALNKNKTWLRMAAPLILVLAFTLLAPAVTGAVTDGGSGDGITQVTFLDVGQGDCAVVRLAQGQVLLIDGGGKEYTPGSVGGNILLPYLKSQRIQAIDYMISSHAHGDHMDGLLSVVQTLPVKHLAVSLPDDTAQQQWLLDVAAKQGCEILQLTAGDRLEFAGAVLEVYAPAKEDFRLSGNDLSLICKLRVGQIDFLFTGDAPAAQLRQATEVYDVSAEILKVSHHGSADGYDPVFYDACHPQAAVISVGADNFYGLPDPEVTEALQERAALYRTDIHGSVTVRTDGQSYSIHPYKQDEAAE
ncbi:MAG: DNA internalization-related competence protein ComEC/Rec2 [Firmicutes bacterium]|nr:DNA internalization-related competence protein ComEC/Rec2 [Bacillota bacterium]